MEISSLLSPEVSETLEEVASCTEVKENRLLAAHLNSLKVKVSRFRAAGGRKANPLGTALLPATGLSLHAVPRTINSARLQARKEKTGHINEGGENSR